MKKIVAVFTAILLLMCGLFYGCEAKKSKVVAAEESPKQLTDYETVKANGKLVIGITNYKPMDYKDDDGEWTGFDAEFARLVCEALDIEAEFIEINWDNKFFELESKAIDCIWNGMTLTDEAAKKASVTNPYVENAQVVVMNAKKLSKYPDVESMSKLKFTAESGSAGEKAIKEAGLKKYTAVAAQSDALLEVSSGSSDACVIDLTMANSMTGKGTSYEKLAYSVKLTSEEYAIAFRKDSDITEKVNEIMAQLMNDGTLDALAEKYELTLVK